MAENTFMLEIVTPEQILFRDEVQFVVAPAVEGELGILRNHAPLVAALKIGSFVIRMPGTGEKNCYEWWFHEVVDNTVRFLAETAEHGHEINVLRAKAAAERARQRLMQRDENINHTRAQLAMQRALAGSKLLG